MITVLENTLTKKKHILNLIDHNGKVFGFDPSKVTHFELRDGKGKILVSNAYCSLEKCLIGANLHFTNENYFNVVSEYDSSIKSFNLILETDDSNSIYSYSLHIDGIDGGYYLEDAGLSKDDLAKLFSKEHLEYWMWNRWTKDRIEDVLKETTTNVTKNVKNWNEKTISEKLEYLYSKILKIEEKVNMLGKILN